MSISRILMFVNRLITLINVFKSCFSSPVTFNFSVIDFLLGWLSFKFSLSYSSKSILTLFANLESASNSSMFYSHTLN